MRSRTSAGLALILVVGVLGILAVLAVTFVTMAQLERKASGQRLYATKAALLARSGIEDALARLSAGQEAAYGGEDWSGDGALSPYEAAQEVYGPGRLDMDACPPAQAMRPSFFVRALPSLNPETQEVGGRERGYSGSLSPDHASRGNIYSLRVVPAEGIFVNGGDLTSAGEHPGTYDGTLKRILGNLAEEVGLPRGAGENLVLNRPAGGWRDLTAAPAAMRPYLVLAAWVDRKVIRPNIDPDWEYTPDPLMDVENAAAWAEIKVGQRDPTSHPNGPIYDAGWYYTYGILTNTGNIGKDWSGRRAFNSRTGSYAPDFERDSAGGIVGRAPVNLNWARDKPPVLRALLGDLKGIYVTENASYGRNSLPENGLERSEGGLAYLLGVSLGVAEVDAVAAALQAHTGFPTWATEFPDWDQTPGFDSWDEFSRFVDLKLTALTQPQRDLLKANFNPNTDSNKFNPGETAYKSLDKSDLTRYSTEFSLRSPCQALSASGRILDASGRLLAGRTLAVTAGFRQVRLTTQSEFCAGNLGALDVAGDETALRKPGDADFLARSDGTGKTHGSRFPGCAPGLALQTYPEPQWPGTPCPRPAAYDGSLQLATVDTDMAAVPGLNFLAAYDDRYDATFAAGNPACAPDERNGPPGQSLLGRNPVGTAAVLNQIYPDGCYAETYREPGYEARLNIGDGYRGILSVWYRPHFGSIPSASGVVRNVSIMDLTLLGVPPSSGIPAMKENTQALSFGGLLQGARVWGMFCENRYADTDVAIEDAALFGKVQTPYLWTMHRSRRWYLLTGQWNVLGAGSAAFSTMCLNGTSHLDPGGFLPYYIGALATHAPPDGGIPPVSETACLTRDCYRADGSFGPPSFYLGSRITAYNSRNCDGTVDELVFKTATADMDECALFAGPRFAAGRYYKEDVPADPYGISPGEWTGAALALGQGARVLRADWTLSIPRLFEQKIDNVPDLWPSPNRIFYGTGEDALAGKTADAAIHLLDGSGASLLPAPLAGRSGSTARLTLSDGTLKLGIDIRPRLDDNTGDWHKLAAPILESPVLDDITLTYTGPEGARLGSWREGE